MYWDSCCFLGLLNQEPGKVNDCTAVWKEAGSGRTIIYTSFFTFTEVIKAKCGPIVSSLPESDDEKIKQLLQQSWIRPLVLDERIAFAARILMRTHRECRKPTDGIHLASAISMNLDEMHTYDKSDLLKLDGKVLRLDGKPQKICTPNPLPPDPNDVISASLFDS